MLPCFLIEHKEQNSVFSQVSFFRDFCCSFLRNPVFTSFLEIHINASYQIFFKTVKKSEVIEEIVSDNSKRHPSEFCCDVENETFWVFFKTL